MARSFTVAALAAAMPSVLAGKFTVNTKAAVAQQAASVDQVSSHVVELQKSGRASRSSSYLKSMRAGADADGFFNHQSWGYPGYGLENFNNTLDEEYTGVIEWAGQPIDVIMDTGSSDTWLAKKGFQCVTKKGKPQKEKKCGFGAVFDGEFQYGEIPDENFYIEYGDLEFLQGTFGLEDVSIGGLTAHKQTVALVELAYWFGDDITAGLMGLAYPALTSEFPGTNVSADDYNKTILYNPIITTLWKEHKMAPVFSLALERESNKGLIALGGLPPVIPASAFYSTPIVIAEIEPVNIFAKKYSFYTVEVEAYLYGTGDELKPSTIGAGSLAILDSGTTLAYLPNRLVKKIAKLFDPPATKNDYFGALGVPCNATAPNFAVQLGGHAFEVSTKDMIFSDSVDPTTGECMVGIIADDGSFPILGDTFLNNVISVFDIGAGEIRLAEHKY